MSLITSTWPSQSGPAPIPTVGMVSAAVTDAARLRGTPSSTRAKAPAASSARASLSIRAAASASFPCTR